MEHLFVVVLFLSVIFLAFIVEKQSKHIREIDSLNLNKIDKYYEQQYKAAERGLKEKLQLQEDSLEKEWQRVSQKHAMELSTLGNEIKKYELILKEKEARYNEVNQDLDLYKQGKIKEIDSAAAEYEQRKRLLVDASIVQYRELRGNLYNDELEAMKARRDSLSQEISDIKSELEVERRKRAAINEEIRRQREVEEQTDFYRIQLDPSDLDDIEILRNIAPRLRHPEAINKIIWTNYYQKPLAELRKRVAIEGPGVYKITRLKTGEIYIGQAVNVSTRWTEHVKSALGVGTLASSQLHRAMAEDGPQQFVFELLEEVPKENLRERESYYIDFYDSKNYGLNSIVGDKK